MKPSKTSTLDFFDFVTIEDPQPQAVPQEQAPAEPTAAAPTKQKKYPPMSVYLSAEQRDIVEQIAKATNQTKHAVLQYAVRKVCNEWQRGIFPDMEMKPKLK